MIARIRRHDRREYFVFVPRQSDAGAALRTEHGIAPELDSIVLIEDGRAFTRSTASLRILRQLGWFGALLGGLLIVPTWLRDPAYAAFARQRYRFGRVAHCALPR